jgi:hypothetical protein
MVQDAHEIKSKMAWQQLLRGLLQVQIKIPTAQPTESSGKMAQNKIERGGSREQIDTACTGR